jgi:hypothetical protein
LGRQGHPSSNCGLADLDAELEQFPVDAGRPHSGLSLLIRRILFLLDLLGLPFKSKSQLAAENAALRQQVIVLQRKVRGRVQLTDSDRLFFIQLYRWFPSVLNAITIVRQ